MFEIIKKYKSLIIIIIIIGIIIISMSPVVTMIRNINAYDVPVNGTIVEIDKQYMAGGRYIITNERNCIAISGDSINSKKKYYMVNDNITTTVKDYEIIWNGRNYNSYKKLR